MLYSPTKYRKTAFKTEKLHPMSSMKKTLLIISCLTVFCVSGNRASAQSFAIKTNLLYDATTSINLGIEFPLSQKWTMDISGNYNPFEFDDGEQWKHWLVQPEFRYWFCDKFAGFYFGMHLHGGVFNCRNCHTLNGIDGHKLFADCSSTRNEGWYYGGGVSLGYEWLIGKRWRFEFCVGAGYVGSDYDIYEPIDDGERIGDAHNDYFGLTKAAVTLVFLLF